MMKILITFFLIIIIFLFNNCATILKGYTDTVRIENAPEDLQIFDEDGIKIPIYEKSIREGIYIYIPTRKQWDGNKIIKVKEINLKSQKEQVLLLKSQGKEKKIKLYGKISGFYLVLDSIFFIYPAFIDAYTSNWYKYDDINAKMNE